MMAIKMVNKKVVKVKIKSVIEPFFIKKALDPILFMWLKFLSVRVGTKIKKNLIALFLIFFSIFGVNCCYAIAVGESYGGGTVFCVSQTADTTQCITNGSGSYGLIMANVDQANSDSNSNHGMSWSSVPSTTGATSISGATNTATILEILPNDTPGNNAAWLCHNYRDSEGHTDWYLPSTNELNKIYSYASAANLIGKGCSGSKIGGAQCLVGNGGIYWSSNEDSGYRDLAWLQNFSNGNVNSTYKVERYFGVRAIRAFAVVLQSIAVTPATSTVTDGTSQQFTATGTYSDGSTQNITTSVTWDSSNTSVATINSSGLATAINSGTTNISATLSGITSSSPAVLTVNPAVLQSIVIAPANTTIADGITKQYTATGVYNDGSTQNITSSVTWNSSNTSVATINSSGLATALDPGTTNITASLSEITSQSPATLTVTSAVLQSIAITPASSTIANRSNTQFTATGTYSDGSTQNITNSVTWNSSNTSVATINSSGLATAVGVGTTNISATLSGITSQSSAALTITAALLQSITITPTSATIANRSTAQFTATGIYSDGSSQNITGLVIWNSSNTSVATINSAGFATGMGGGTTNMVLSQDL